MRSLCKRLWLNSLRAVRNQPAKASRPPALVVEELESRLVPSANYYVSPSGNDAHDGLSPQTAWRTTGRVGAQQYGPGDTINFQGGATYDGGLFFYTPDGGTAGNPVTVTSYNGRATINTPAGTGNGLWLWDVSGFHITNLNFTGGSDGVNVFDGIKITSLAGVMSDIYIDNVDISGFNQGIEAYADPNRAIVNLQITYVTVHDDSGIGNPIYGTAGIVAYGSDPSQRSIWGLYIGHVAVYNNTNQFGIFVQNLEGGVVERSEVHDIGGPLNRNVIGIAAWDSDAVTFQYNEAYDIIDPSVIDGDGLFFGDGVTNSVMQYNYAHDNTSFGLELVSDLPGGAANVGNTVRYNIAENNGSAGVVVAGRVWDAEVYNNTFYAGVRSSTGPALDVFIYNWSGASVHFRNNILQGTSDSLNVWTNLNSGVTGRDLLFQNNVYYLEGGGFTVGYVDHWFSSLSEWQNATDEEMLDDGTSVGYAGDPQLVAPGQGGTIGDPDQLATLTAYYLQPTSLLDYTGLDLLALFGIDPGGQDFYGNPLGQAPGVSVGAYQALGFDVPKLKAGSAELALALPSPLEAQPLSPAQAVVPLDGQIGLQAQVIDWGDSQQPSPPAGDGGSSTALGQRGFPGPRAVKVRGLEPSGGVFSVPGTTTLSDMSPSSALVE